jgi:hypothetical protein
MLTLEILRESEAKKHAPSRIRLCRWNETSTKLRQSPNNLYQELWLLTCLGRMESRTVRLIGH